MKMIRLSILLVAVAATLAVGVVAMVSSSAGASKATVIHVVERATTDAVTNGDAETDKVGNVLTFSNNVYNSADKRKVGSDQGYCVRMVVGKTWECNWTTFLQSGSLTVEGKFSDTGNTILAITGGTGAYATARGEMNLNYHNKQGTEFDFIFHVKK
ncbi:MAG TPA: dirigent protein [Solirubrobacterales bacterium]|jgi:allene oxide cyclase